MELNEITKQVIGAAMAVHRELGLVSWSRRMRPVLCMSFFSGGFGLRGRRNFPWSTAGYGWSVDI